MSNQKGQQPGDNGFLSIIYAVGAKPLQNWNYQIKNGHIKRVTDPDIEGPSLEIIGANVDANYLFTPIDSKKSLNITMPTIVLLIKNLQKYFEFSVTIIDDKKIERTFKASNFQTLTRVKGNFCSLPIKMEDGWNQLHINLDDFTKKAFGTVYKETKRVQINANCRIRRIYFTEFPVNYKRIPPEFKVFAAIEEDTSEKNAQDVVIEEDQEV